MFKRVLVANRGEIALRVIYALKELGIESVAIYSEADKHALHVSIADYSVCVGPPPPQESYLNIPRIISAAEVAGADAIHPGYGFLAENPEFAEIVEKAGFTFIGPSADAIRLMGDKIAAKKVMSEAGVPILPGTLEPVSTYAVAEKIVREIGLPVIIKAAAGGGGRGMRVVEKMEDLKSQLETAQKEAELAFSDGRVYIEKYIKRPRHIEVQILADKFGNTIHLGERECSIQRRHQKLLEESPSVVVDENTREKLGEIAIRGAKKIGYYSAGTMEFIRDEDGNFYFMEMNTRIQVEHPVTEWVTMIDLVKEQIRIAANEKLDVKQEEVEIKGHAIEVRINAEDPDNNFAPSPGKITFLHLPGGPGIRVDSAIYHGYEIPPHYDSLLAKLIARGRDRNEAIARMRRALDEFIIEGVKTTIPLFKKILNHPDFVNGVIDTRFLERL